MKSAFTIIPSHHRRGRGFGYALSLLRHISLVAAKRFEVVLCRCRCPLLRQAVLQISCHETPTQRLHDCSSCAVAAIRSTTQVVLERTDSFLFAGAMLCEPGDCATCATSGIVARTMWCSNGQTPFSSPGRCRVGLETELPVRRPIHGARMGCSSGQTLFSSPGRCSVSLETVLPVRRPIGGVQTNDPLSVAWAMLSVESESTVAHVGRSSGASTPQSYSSRTDGLFSPRRGDAV